MQAGNPAGAAAELQPAIESPAFQALEEQERYTALVARGVAALMLDDARALTYLRQASTMPGASWQAWYARVHAAWLAKDRSEAAGSLATTARRWPEDTKRLEPDLIFAIVRESRKVSDPGARLELFDALYDAKWKPAALEPSWMWSELARLHLERGEPLRAAEVTRRVRAPREIIAMRVDRRFDALVSADPGTFDVQLAQENEIAQLRAAMNSSPRSLRIRLELAYALEGARRYEQVLDLLEGAVSGIDTYDDGEEFIPWAHDQRSRALQALDRTDEAVRELEIASRLPTQQHQDLSHKINLGWLYCKLDRPHDALGTAKEVLLADASEYGRAQVETVRVLAGLELHDAAMVREALASLRDLAASDPDVLQWPLVQAGELAEASRLMLKRLADPDLRKEALLSVQRYAGDAVTPRQREWERYWEAFLSRPEVRAAIEKVGRRERFLNVVLIG